MTNPADELAQVTQELIDLTSLLAADAPGRIALYQGEWQLVSDIVRHARAILAEHTNSREDDAIDALIVAAHRPEIAASIGAGPADELAEAARAVLFDYDKAARVISEYGQKEWRIQLYEELRAALASYNAAKAEMEK